MTAVVTAPRPTAVRVQPRSVLLIASFGAFLAFLDATIVNVAFPSIRESFPDTTISGLSWVLNAYNIAFAAFLIPFGRVADLLGRRRCFAWGVAIFTVGSLACAASPSVELLVGFRTLQALGAALLVPASLALVVAAFPAERRVHAVGLWGAAAAVAAGLGPPIGGVLVEAGGWRWAFLINLPFGVLAYLLARRRLVESRAPGRRRLPDIRGALLLALALGLLTLGIVQGNDWGWTSAATLGAFLAAAAALAGFVVSSRRHRSPLLDPALLRIRPFAVGSVATVAAGKGFFAYLLTNILWLTYVWDYSILLAGSALVPGALVAAVVAAVLGPHAARLGYRPLVVLGSLVWALSYLWYATQVGVTPAFLTEWLPGQLLSGIGVGVTLPLLASAGLAAVPGGRYATASAFVSSARQVGGVLGIAVLVLIIGTPTASNVVTNLRHGWWLSVWCFLGCAALSLFLGQIPAAAEEPDDAQAARTGMHLPSAAAAPPADSQIDALPLLGRLPVAVRDQLRSAAAHRLVHAGEWLLSAADPADSMYLIHSGQFEVLVDGEVVRLLGPGAVVGELALLSGGTRSASVRARRDSEVAAVSRQDFQDAMSMDPRAYLELATVLAEQLRDARPAPLATGLRPRVVAVVGLHRGAPHHEVAAALLRAVRTWGSAEVLMRPQPEALRRAEQSLDLVLVSADTEDEGWRETVRQADLVVAVAASDADPTIGPGPGVAHPELVLVGARPNHQVAADWCTALRPWQLTTVGPGPAPDELRSLGARLTGNAVGVVMAGGGARAFAHIGVLQELAAAGIQVDRVAGASVGAIVAGLHATGLDGDELHDICYREFVRGNPFGDYTLPTVSLAKGRRTKRAMRRHLGGLEISALPRQFRAVSVDLLRRERVEHSCGDLADAVLSSASLPVLFPPNRSGDRLLVDGGVLDNLPVGLLTERDEGPVLAVNITMGGGGPARTGPPRMPGLGDTLLRTMMIGSAGAVQRARDRGVTVLTPPAMGVGLLEFHQLDIMVAAGRTAVRELLAATGGVIPGR
jgi:EmrB/QacA subfamily drug resistance transporter